MSIFESSARFISPFGFSKKKESQRESKSIQARYTREGCPQGFVSDNMRKVCIPLSNLNAEEQKRIMGEEHLRRLSKSLKQRQEEQKKVREEMIAKFRLREPLGPLPAHITDLPIPPASLAAVPLVTTPAYDDYDSVYYNDKMW